MEWNNDEHATEEEGSSHEPEASPESGSGHGSHCSCKGCKGGRKGKGMLFSLLAFLLIIVSVLWIASYLGLSFRPLAAAGGVNEWKAVFLSNGQVYFGKVRNEQADPLVLSDIYYLQVQQQLQPVQPGQQAQAQQQLTLIKFGNELHGPHDQMRIVRDNVLYIESLKDSGRVVDAINRYLTEEAESDGATIEQ